MTRWVSLAAAALAALCGCRERPVAAVDGATAPPAQEAVPHRELDMAHIG